MKHEHESLLLEYGEQKKHWKCSPCESSTFSWRLSSRVSLPSVWDASEWLSSWLEGFFPSFYFFQDLQTDLDFGFQKSLPVFPTISGHCLLVFGSVSKTAKTIIFDMSVFQSVRPSIRPHVRTQFTFTFSRNFIFLDFSEIRRVIQDLLKFDKKKRHFTWRPMSVYDNILLKSS